VHHKDNELKITFGAIKTMQFKQYECLICGWVYDEAAGSPEEGIKPGTRWEDVPDDWVCPDCAATKDQFEMVEI